MDGDALTANLGPRQATISKTCITCLFVILVLYSLLLLTIPFFLVQHLVLLAGGNPESVTTFEPIYEDEVVKDSADRDYYLESSSTAPGSMTS